MDPLKGDSGFWQFAVQDSRVWWCRIKAVKGLELERLSMEIAASDLSTGHRSIVNQICGADNVEIPR